MSEPMTREEFVATLSEYAVACAINGWVPGDSPEKSRLYAHDAALRARLAEAEAALREVEAHHVAQNTRKGRDEARSTTLRIVRRVLAPKRQP